MAGADPIRRSDVDTDVRCGGSLYNFSSLEDVSAEMPLGQSEGH